MMARPYRIIFMGTPAFAVPSLQALLDHGEEVAAVVCQPDRPRGRGRKTTPPAVKELAQTVGLPVLQPTAIKSDVFLAQVRALAPDLIVVAAYGRILPGPLLNLPPLGTINVHGSLLPKYRGAAPIQWAILNGETETGITIMQMDEGMDTGDILLARSLTIDPDDTAGSLAARMAILGGQSLIEALELLKQGKLAPRPQDNRLATLAPPLRKDQGAIDWQRPAAAIGCQIRGLDPWPTAYTTLNTTRLRLFRPAVLEEPATAEPGVLCRIERQGLVIATGKGCLLVREIQRPGGKRLPVAAFVQGHPLKPGSRFGS